MSSFVCTSMSNGHIVLLRTYLSSSEEHVPCKVWEAGRATSAAPTFFDPIKLANGAVFRDGALRDNNPLFQLINEARIEFPNQKISAIVSIGTGVPTSIVLSNGLTSVAKACAKIATNAEIIARRFEEAYCFPGGPYEESYFRFNVSRGVEGVQLEEWHKADIMRSNTLAYLQEESQRLKACAIHLQGSQALNNQPEDMFAGSSKSKDKAVESHLNVGHGETKMSFPPGGEMMISHTRKGSQSQAIHVPMEMTSLQDVIPAPQYTTSSTELQVYKIRPSRGCDERHRTSLDLRFYQLDRIGKQPVPYFVSRQEQEQINQAFAEAQRPLKVRTVYLVGLGGSGKSQLMLDYAWSARDDYGVVLWIDASSTPRIAESFKLAASQLGLRLPPFESPSSTNMALDKYTSEFQRDLTLIKSELRRRQQRWLVLFGEADDLEVIRNLSQYMPSEGDGNILVSSRRKEARLLGHRTIQVKGLPLDGAGNLLLHHACIDQPTQDQLRCAEKIAETLDCIALAVDLAGA